MEAFLRQTAPVLPPLVLTGGPAVGKSTTAGRLARGRPRAAVVDVDDVRLMVVAGHIPPWRGGEGAAQHRLGIQNACGLAQRFLTHRIDVVLADVLTPNTTRLYRDLLPSCLIIRLQVTAAEAERRASMRPVYLTDNEFKHLDAQDRDDPPPADHHLEVTAMTLEQQVTAVSAFWYR